MDRGRVGEERGSKETDGCPLTVPQSILFGFPLIRQVLYNLPSPIYLLLLWIPPD
jgi:hypothetical protein